MRQCSLGRGLRETTPTEFTIDELAQRTGMTVRNIRAHQSRGLIDPPDVRGRTGYYGPDHEARIALIQDLQSEGFNLESIRRLIDAAPDEGGEPLRFLRTLAAPYRSEAPEPVTPQQLLADWGPDGPPLLERVIELGVVAPDGNGGFVYPSPGLVKAARQLVELGVPLERQLEVVEQMRAHAGGIAQTYVDLFIEQIWKPFQEQGEPEERWPEVSEAIGRLRPLAVDAMMAVFASAMEDSTEEALGRELRARPS